MSTTLNTAATVIAFLVFLVLAAGLLNLVRTDSTEASTKLKRPDRTNTSQILMRWRVGLQFIAIVLLVVSAWLAKYF